MAGQLERYGRIHHVAGNPERYRITETDYTKIARELEGYIDAHFF